MARLRQDGGEQLIQRVSTNSGSARAGCLWASEGATKNNTIQYVHDRMGNIIAEATSAGATAREYIWLPEAEIAPTSRGCCVGIRSATKKLPGAGGPAGGGGRGRHCWWLASGKTRPPRRRGTWPGRMLVGIRRPTKEIICIARSA